MTHIWHTLPPRKKWYLHYRQIRCMLGDIKRTGRNRGFHAGGAILIEISPTPKVLKAEDRWERTFAEAALACRV